MMMTQASIEDIVCSNYNTDISNNCQISYIVY